MMRSPDNSIASRVSYLALMTALSAVLGYLELLIPINLFGIPGVKLGLANIVSLMVLYSFGPLSACMVVLSRVILLGLLFGNPYSFLFSAAGGLMSLAAMYVLKKSGFFTMTGVSAGGGVFHNTGQLLIALLTLKGISFVNYFPVLVMAGCICGSIMGILGGIIYDRIDPYIKRGII
ncbi:MAG: Gx transporter family protein [Lachnospiraceae bacterium]|nr:Gx transporter family protein [Lachnospiraceae bacterium]